MMMMMCHDDICLAFTSCLFNKVSQYVNKENNKDKKG